LIYYFLQGEAGEEKRDLRSFLEDYGGVCEWLNKVQKEREQFVDSAQLSQLVRNFEISKNLYEVKQRV
jgi:hypothetical protein